MFADDNQTKGRKIIRELGKEFGQEKTAFIKSNFTDKKILESMKQ